MITYAKMTGNAVGNKVEVAMVTMERRYIDMQLSNLNVSLPSNKWIEENKDKFLAIVFTGRDHEVDCIIGFHPVIGADSSAYNTHERLLATTKELVTVIKGDLVGTLKNDLVSSALKNLTAEGVTPSPGAPIILPIGAATATALSNVETKLGDVEDKLEKIIESLDEIKELIREVKL